MPRIDKYYQITQNETQNVSIYWKVTHVLLLGSAAICSFGVTYSLEASVAAFGNNCLFYSHLVFQNTSRVSHYKAVGNFSETMSFHNPYTTWGTMGTCRTYNFAFLLICIVGLILLAFFLIVSRGGAGIKGDLYMDPWKIVIPSILISIVVSVVSLVLYIKIKFIFFDFCTQFAPILSTHTCSKAIDEFTLIYSKQKIKVSWFIYLTQRFSSLTLLLWCLLSLTLIYRLIRGSDFKIIVYHIKKAQKEDDEDDTDDSSDDSILDTDKNPDKTAHAVIPAEKVKHEITWL